VDSVVDQNGQRDLHVRMIRRDIDLEDAVLIELRGRWAHLCEARHTDVDARRARQRAAIWLRAGALDEELDAQPGRPRERRAIHAGTRRPRWFTLVGRRYDTERYSNSIEVDGFRATLIDAQGQQRIRRGSRPDEVRFSHLRGADGAGKVRFDGLRGG